MVVKIISVKIIILLVSKGFYFFFREILTLMSKNSSILESFLRITASVLLLLLNLLCSLEYVTVLLYLDRTTVVVFFKRNKFLNENMAALLPFC